MQRLFAPKALANSRLAPSSARAFSAGPKANPFDRVKTSLGNSQFFKLPALGDQRLCKWL